MTATGKPSSGPKTKIAGTEAKKDISKHDAKGKTEAAGSGKIAAGKQPSPGPKSKNAEAEAKKQNGKGKAESANSKADGRAAAKPGRQAASARKSERSLN
jgi:hypothetical protein